MITERLIRVLTLADYNTRIVMFGTITLGIAGGIVGVFLLLRRRALLADAVSHAALPGVAGAFLLTVALGGDPRSLPLLMTGALVSGLLGMGCVLMISRFTRLSQDAALGIVLSVFFGLGIALLGIIQKMSGAPAAGLDSFIYGKAATIIREDALLIGSVALAIILITGLLFKEFRLLTFDPEFAVGDGWPVQRLDLILMALVVAVTVIGLQAVGIILIVAILILPPVAARFWTDRLLPMVFLSAIFGALGGWIGTSISALAPRLPAGAVIVVSLGSLFLVSFLFGADRGVIRVIHRTRATARRTLRQHLLRAFFEYEESGGSADAEEQHHYVARLRGWGTSRYHRAVRMLARDRAIYRIAHGPWQFTAGGRAEAARITRNHRLWEVYLLEHADIAPAHVDYGADFIEHVLGDELVAELERALPRFGKTVPQSIHRIDRTEQRP
ncbi:MAG: iron chelate uptake ABC transporter family permease subunit [Alkalispirochaeta sp.]